MDIEAGDDDRVADVAVLDQPTSSFKRIDEAVNFASYLQRLVIAGKSGELVCEGRVELCVDSARLDRVFFTVNIAWKHFSWSVVLA